MVYKNIKFLFAIFFLALHFISCASDTKESQKLVHGKNHLGKEKSPYLLQHKNNPVWWYAWGEEALSAAKKQDKLIFLSIGYSTCHWCHVMEKQSFEKEDVAKILNENFISIKVDREERPDVDKIYMGALYTMGRRGGWPLTIVMTPDLKPFFGGTYFPREKLKEILLNLAQAWKNDRGQVNRVSQKIYKTLESVHTLSAGDVTLNDNIFKTAYAKMVQRFDFKEGGFGQKPKFPPTVRLKVLLRIYRRTGEKKSLSMVEKTLDKMARGGMYDHLGGGFHRYSTDGKWLVPHFEKMLYDNANLSQIYLETYQITKKPFYAAVAREILDYILRDMTSSKGGFYSAEDADSEGHEGKFYVWHLKELKKLLSTDEYKIFASVYGITEKGNFEHKTNILNLQNNYDWNIKADPKLKSAQEKLFPVREKRIHPYKDDKIVTSWNGLMIASMAKAYQVLREEKYLKAAQKAAGFVRDHLYKEGKLFRRYRDGEKKFAGTLDDYAYVIQGLLTLYQTDFNPGWIKWAEELQRTQDSLMWDEKNGGYYFAGVGVKNLLVRTREFGDNARPNGNGMAALNLLELYGLTFNKAYKERAEKIFQAVGDRLAKYPPAYAQLLIALDYYTDDAKEIAVVGQKDSADTSQILNYLQETFLPNQVTAFSVPDKTDEVPLLNKKTEKNGKTTVYICEDFICKAPTTDLNQVKKLIAEKISYKLR